MSNTTAHHSDKFTRRKKHLRQEITVICQRAVIAEGTKYWEENDEIGIPVQIQEITATVDQADRYPVDFPSHAIHSNGYNHALARQGGVEYLKGQGKWVIKPLSWLKTNSKHDEEYITNQYNSVEEYNKDVKNKDVYPFV